MGRAALALLVVACTWGLPSPTSSASDVDLKVIVHPSVPVTELSRAELEAIFKAQDRTWPGNQTIVPFNQDKGTAARAAFDEAVLGLEEHESAKYWIDTLVRGGPRPPRTVAVRRLIPRLVVRLPGSISYVRASRDVGDARVVARIRRGSVVAP